MQAEDDDLSPSTTVGYVPGEKKTLQELQNLDAHDGKLNPYERI